MKLLRLIKQKLCKHQYHFMGSSKYMSGSLYQCKKCKIYYIHHYGIDEGYNSSKPPKDHFNLIKLKGENNG